LNETVPIKQSLAYILSWELNASENMAPTVCHEWFPNLFARVLHFIA